MSVRDSEHEETVIIGGGQAGLTLGYHLARRGRPFVILDAHERIGDAWRKRWDSLRLFTPALFSRLPGMPLPAPRWSFPTKDEMADYLESYAERFELPVRTGVKVDGVSKVDGSLRRLGRRRALRGRERDRRDRRAPDPEDPRVRRRSSTRGSCSCTPASTATPRSSRRAAYCSSAPGTREPSISIELARGRHRVLAGPKIGQIPVRHRHPPGTSRVPDRFGSSATEW